jgi:hypothetical protein
MWKHNGSLSEGTAHQDINFEQRVDIVNLTFKLEYPLHVKLNKLVGD